MTNDLKHIIDATAAGVGIATWFHLMPDIAATMAVLWYITRFYEYINEKLNGKSRE